MYTGTALLMARASPISQRRAALTQTRAAGWGDQELSCCKSGDGEDS